MMCKHPTDRWLSPYEPEDTRSKRVGGISSFSSFTEAVSSQPISRHLQPLSWRAAYRRIIPRHLRVRTFDGYLFLIKRQALDRYQRVVLTGVAQRKRAGLITPRTSDRNGPPVYTSFSSFTEAATHKSYFFVYIFGRVIRNEGCRNQHREGLVR